MRFLEENYTCHNKVDNSVYTSLKRHRKQDYSDEDIDSDSDNDSEIDGNTEWCWSFMYFFNSSAHSVQNHFIFGFTQSSPMHFRSNHPLQDTMTSFSCRSLAFHNTLSFVYCSWFFHPTLSFCLSLRGMLLFQVMSLAKKFALQGSLSKTSSVAIAIACK